jgi:hypothetical protein
MKKFIIGFIVIFLLAHTSFSQTNFEKRMREVRTLVQKTLPLDASLYSSTKEEYFLLDIYLDPETKNIKNSVILCQDSANHISFVRNALDKIKAEWKPVKTTYTRLLIPIVFIISGKNDTDDFLVELPLSIPKAQSKTTYLAKEIVCDPGFPMR